MPGRGTGKKVKRKTFTQGGRVYDASTAEAVPVAWRNYLKTDSTPTKKEFGEFLGKEVKGLKVGKMTGSAVTESEKKRLKKAIKRRK